MKHFFWFILVFLVSCQQLEPANPVRAVPETEPAIDLSPSLATARWSDPATWASGKVPQLGEDVVIPEGKAVLLDQSLLKLASLTVNGTLVFADQDIDLSVSAITVKGRLEVGAPSKPFTAKARISLTGSKQQRLITVAPGGVLSLHAQSATSWTRLAKHALPGDSRLSLADRAMWQVGDQIVLASSDFDFKQAERFEIRDLQKTDVYLDKPLAYLHWGEVQHYNGQVLDERAELAHLTRRIVIQGDAGSEAEGIGGHIIVLAGGHAFFDGVEFYRMGQRGELGRYPIHWHMMGNSSRGQYLKNSSIHESFNRCVTIHASNGIQLINNVAFQTEGHCFFLEDGNEVDNIFRYNLVIASYQAKKPLLPSDTAPMGPASYWISNPANLFEHNVAAGSAGMGFWYALAQNPTGPSVTKDIWPRFTPLAGFRGNVAHSNDIDGLHVDHGPKSDVQAGLEPSYYDPRLKPSAVQTKDGYVKNSSKEVSASFETFLAYKNRRNGAWLRGQNHLLSHSVFADNAIGLTFASQKSRAVHNIFIGESQNLGTPEPWMIREKLVGLDGRHLPRFWQPEFSLRGFEFYDGDVEVSNSHFEAFIPNTQRQAAALSYLDFTDFFVSPKNTASELSFSADTNRLYLASRSVPEKAAGGEDGYRSALFIDKDGSVSGQERVAITVNNPFLLSKNCYLRSDWNAYVCPEPYASLQFVDLTRAPKELSPLSLIREDGVEHVMLGEPNANSRFTTNVRLGERYHYQLKASPSHFRLNLRSITLGQSLILSLPYEASEVFIYRDYWIDKRNLLKKSSSLADFEKSFGHYYYLQDGRLYLKLVAQESRDWAVLDICQRSNCP